MSDKGYKDEALTLVNLANRKCENFARWSCQHEWSGKYPNAKYGADDYCYPCTIRHIIGLGERI